MEHVNGIPKANLEHGAYYAGHCRNATIARWNADKNVFVHWRTKFGSTFTEEIHHIDDDNVYDIFVATKKLDKVDKEIPF